MGAGAIAGLIVLASSAWVARDAAKYDWASWKTRSIPTGAAPPSPRPHGFSCASYFCRSRCRFICGSDGTHRAPGGKHAARGESRASHAKRSPSAR
jgi:hypothetical protein